MLSLIFAAIEDESDRQYLEWLHEEYRRLMLATAYEYTQDFGTCEDIVQETLLKLIKVVSLLRTRACPVVITYLKTAVRNTAINYLKKEARWQKVSISLDQMPFLEIAAPEQSIEELVLIGERLELLKEVWHLLPEEEQILLAGKYLLDASDEELAECLGCKASSIRMKLTRARRDALGLIIERMEEGEPV